MRPASLATSLALALAAAGAAVTAGCDIDDPVARGQALFSDPTAGGGKSRPFNCSFCHDVDATDGITRPGNPMRNIAFRATFWGGEQRTLREAASLCATTFMLGTGFLPDDPDWLALRRYLESVSDASVTAALALTKPRDCTKCPDPTCSSCAPAAKGDGDKGADVYRRACRACHGDFGDGRTGRLQVAGESSTAPAFDVDPTTMGAVLEGTDGPTDPDNNPNHVSAKVRFGSFALFGVPGPSCAKAVLDAPQRVASHLSCSPNMPPFAPERLSDAELTNLVTYLFPERP